APNILESTIDRIPVVRDSVCETKCYGLAFIRHVECIGKVRSVPNERGLRRKQLLFSGIKILSRSGTALKQRIIILLIDVSLRQLIAHIPQSNRHTKHSRGGTLILSFTSLVRVLAICLNSIDVISRSRGKVAIIIDLRKHTSSLGIDTSLHLDRKSTRLNSSHVSIPYAVFCLKKKIILVP